MKKHIGILTLFLILTAAAAHGQALREELARAGEDGARVRVEMSSSLSVLLDRVQPIEGQQVEGYRVYIYNENHQRAGTEARQTLARFQGLFPDIPAEIIKRRDSPYWKVAVGGSLSRDEVMMVFGRIKSAFPGAYTPAAELLPLSGFLLSSP